MASSEPMDALRMVVERELADLIRMFAKLLRAGFNTGPTAPLVRGWVSQNPDAGINVATALAALQGVTFDDMADAAIENPNWIIELVGHAAFAAAKGARASDN